MPPAKTSSSRAKARPAPYPTSKPNPPPNDKENEAPRDSASPIDQASNVEERKKTLVNKKASKSAPRDANNKANPDLPDSYLDIDLKERKGEVPCYENVAAIRRKLNALLEKKAKIPGSNTAFNKINLSKELCEVAQRHHAIETTAGHRAAGPSVKALTAFFLKSDGMGVGDSESYYYGNILLEKMRKWTGDKRSKAREKAEQEFPNGRYRTDPAHFKILCRPGEAPTRSEVANMKR